MSDSEHSLDYQVEPELAARFFIMMPQFQAEMAKLPTETERQQFIRATQLMFDINPQLEKMLAVSDNASLLVNLLLLVSLILKFPGLSASDRQKLIAGYSEVKQQYQTSQTSIDAVVATMAIAKDAKDYETMSSHFGEFFEKLRSQRDAGVQLFRDLCHGLHSLSGKDLAAVDEALAKYEQYLESYLTDFESECELMSFPNLIAERAESFMAEMKAKYGADEPEPESEWINRRQVFWSSYN